MLSLTPTEKNDAIEALCHLVTFETVAATAPSSGEYCRCAQYIISRLRSIPCLDSVHILKESPPDSPVVLARWAGQGVSEREKKLSAGEEEEEEVVDEDYDDIGKNELLPVLLLNSHYDVVPAPREDWSVEPFSGLRKEGKIFGRGTQDMKSVCIQYMEAIRKLHQLQPSYKPKRSIYLTFVPDEEVDGAGMATFLSSKLYHSLPGIALALDEGLASTTNTYSVFYGERLPWYVDVIASGNTGHGSRFINDTAVEQIVSFANKALTFRKGQRDALHGSSLNGDHSNCSHAVAAKMRRRNKEKKGRKMTLGDVTSLNITTLQAGVRAGDSFVYNCVPPTARCTMDIRISPHVDPVEMSTLLDSWCIECSSSNRKSMSSSKKKDSSTNNNQLTWEFTGGYWDDSLMQHGVTSTDPKVNPWYHIFVSTLEKMMGGNKIEPEVFPAATDSRLLRCMGIRALGFSPMRNSEILLHENDEHIDESVFLEGIGVYVGLIEALGRQGAEIDGKNG